MSKYPQGNIASEIESALILMNVNKNDKLPKIDRK